MRIDSDSKEPCNFIFIDSNNPTELDIEEQINVLPIMNETIVGSQPPMVAFGSEGGGSPLFINQDYSFGVLAGILVKEAPIKIEVYEKSSFALGKTNVRPVFTKTYNLPANNHNNKDWEEFYKNGYIKEIHLQETINGKNIDFTTSIQPVFSGNISETWGMSLPFFPLMVTHRAGNSDFYYKISFQGMTDNPLNPSQPLWLSVPHYNVSYTLDFEEPPSWSIAYLNSPSFQGILLPEAYQGKNLDELIHAALPIKDTLSKPENTGFNLTQVNSSPELKSHTTLDELSASLGNDPFTIANYVQNEIELTDAVGYNTRTGNLDISLNSQGVMRDALATYLEGEGSPIEQCELLIYLLRKAGYPAAYIFPEHNKTLMLDKQLSNMLHVQIRGTLSFLGDSYLPELIPVNYPWVVTYINGQWIHLFPWIKDTEVIEGKDIWKYFPEGYCKPEKWLNHYIFNDPAIRGLSPHGEEDGLGALLKMYTEEELKNFNMDLEDVGMKFRNRPHYYTKWEDFPRPWQTSTITNDNLVQNLDAQQNPTHSKELENIFDTISIQILSDRNGDGQPAPDKPMLETGPMRFVDLHDRRLLLYHQVIPESKPTQYNMILSLEPYDIEHDQDKAYTFTKGINPDPGTLRSEQRISTRLQSSSDYILNLSTGKLTIDGPYDDQINYKITTSHHQQASNVNLKGNYYEQFPGLWEMTTFENTNSLRKGDMAALSLNYGRVSQRMLDFELQKYKNYSEECAAHPEIQKNPERLTGQIVHSMGKGYYLNVGTDAQEIEDLLKTHTISWRAYGLSKLSPERDDFGAPILTADRNDFNLVYPRVDMFYSKAAAIGNETSHLESGDSGLKSGNALKFILVDGSAQEHRIINEFFNQNSAISTIKLLDIAQGWTPETGIASHPGIGIEQFDLSNYRDVGNTFPTTGNSVIDAQTIQTWADRGGIWSSIEEALRTSKDVATTVFLTGHPITAPGQQGKPYTGLGGLILSCNSASALISDSMSIDHGGYGGATIPISSSNPNNNNEFNHWIDKVNQSKFDEAVKAFNSSKVSPPAPTYNIGIPSPSPAIPSAEISVLKQQISNNGFMGFPSYYGKLLNFVKDPVSVVTGEFYINALDLRLNGPMPLEMRRLYSSQDQSNNNLGAGWKLSLFPYLVFSNDATETTPPSSIYAAEMDGSVICYHYNNDQKIWKPEPKDNPNLINPNDGSLTPSHNLFNNTITKTDDQTYLLKGADGNTRTFKIKSFPLLGSPEITRTRPYLENWQDTQGNSYTFTYGINNKSNDYALLSLITSSNGNNLHFRYNYLGNIIETLSNDGRRVLYDYDKEGNLIKVTLPDNSIIKYVYQKETHLLTQEIKPNGRILQNTYDDNRRVLTQASTVSISPTPITNATFSYNVISTNTDNTINGTTAITDAQGNTTAYTINESQISKIDFPQNYTLTQTWNSRALTSRTDPRGLTTSYIYDTQGNLTTKTLNGNITGSGNSESATTTFTYNTQNVLTSIVDSLGNSINYNYNDSKHPNNPTAITKIEEGKTTSITQIIYQSQGLPTTINNNGAATNFTYDDHGFLISKIRQTKTGNIDFVTQYTTNLRGEIVSETDQQGVVKKYSYDAFGRPTFDEIFDKTGALVDWHALYYNFNGEIAWRQGARFNPVDYSYYDYDRSGNLIHKATWLSQADSEGVTTGGLAVTSYAYDSQGNCISITNPNGHVTTMTYDALGEMLSRTLGNGSAQEFFTYEPGGKIASHTTFLGGNESYAYTSTGLLQSASQADGTTTNYRYDLIGRLIQAQPSHGATCDIAYNGNTITRTFSASGKNLGSTSETYDGRGNLLEKTDLAGNTWSFSYDGLNRIKTEQSPTQKVIHYYKPGCESWVNSEGIWENSFFDAAGRKILTTLFNPDGTTAYNESNFYNPDHQSVTTTIGTGASAIINTFYTDTRGLPILLKHSDESYQIMGYDANGNRSFFINEEGVTTTYAYDALNHLSSETLPGGATIKYSCDPAGNLLTRSMPEGLTEQNIYNTAGQKTASSLTGSDDTTTRNYTYEYQNGLLSSATDPRGFTMSIDYDVWMRPTKLSSSGSGVPEQNQTTTYTYDPRGLLTSVAQQYNDPSTGPSTLVSRAYDAYGQLTSETTSLNNTNISSWTQSWDAAGRRTALNWNIDKQSKGGQYAFSYTALGEVTSSQNGSGTNSYMYSDNGLLSQKSTPSGTTTFTRDKNGNIVTAILPDISTESLTYRSDGKIASYAISGTAGNETRNYEYDASGRINKEPYLLPTSTGSLSAGTKTASYFFDDLNFRLKQEVSSDIANVVSEKDSFSQGIIDSLNPDASSPTSWTSSYDHQGNLITHSSDSNNQSLTWDSFGRLVKVTQGANNQSHNWKAIYDGLGRRIQTTSEGDVINYYYDPEIEFLELGHSVNGNRQWNLYGPDRSGLYGGAQGIGGLEACLTENTKSSFGIVNNHFGDVVGLMKSGSFTPYQSALGAYGAMPGSSVNQALQPQWRGHYLDPTGFICMGTRYYDPQSGRFLSPDPLGHSSSLSLYDYCNGDPVNGLDPDGRCVEKGKQEFAEGYDKSYYANGADVQYGNSIQQFGGFVEKSLSKTQPVIGTDPGTIAIGLQFNVAAGLQFNVSAQGSISNWADPATRRIGAVFAVTPLIGVSTGVGISGGVLTTKSNVNAPEKLNGWSGSGGGSVSLGGFVGGYEYGNWGKDPTYNSFSGFGVMPSVVVPLPAEVHTSATWTRGWSWNF